MILSAILIIAGLWNSSAWAIPAPARPMTSVEGAPQKELVLKTELRNIVGPSSERMDRVELVTRIVEVNRILAQCSIRLEVNAFANIEASKLGVTDSPASMNDLALVASKLNPNGFPALPVTVAGKWDVVDRGTRLFGLGWVFMSNHGIDRIGAMISNAQIHLETAAAVIAHEVGHALSLSDVQERDNLMGTGGTHTLTRDQCAQARRFARNSLKSLIDG